MLSSITSDYDYIFCSRQTALGITSKRESYSRVALRKVWIKLLKIAPELTPSLNLLPLKSVAEHPDFSRSRRNLVKCNKSRKHVINHSRISSKRWPPNGFTVLRSTAATAQGEQYNFSGAPLCLHSSKRHRFGFVSTLTGCFQAWKQILQLSRHFT